MCSVPAALLPADTKGQGVKEQLKDWTKVEKPEVPEKVAQAIKEVINGGFAFALVGCYCRAPLQILMSF